MSNVAITRKLDHATAPLTLYCPFPLRKTKHIKRKQVPHSIRGERIPAVVSRCEPAGVLRAIASKVTAYAPRAHTPHQRYSRHRRPSQVRLARTIRRTVIYCSARIPWATFVFLFRDWERKMAVGGVWRADLDKWIYGTAMCMCVFSCLAAAWLWLFGRLCCCQLSSNRIYFCYVWFCQVYTIIKIK